MGWVGGYRLELTCNKNGGTYITREDGVVMDSAGHVLGEFPHVYTGELGVVMRQNARRDGWMVAPGGAAVCPKCTRKSKRKNHE